MRPATEAELADILKGANAPLAVCGGGTRAIGALSGAAVQTGGLAGVRLYEPGALTLVAGAGTRLAEVEAALAAEGQRLPFEPPDLRALLGRGGESTIGGVVAANESGPRRVQAGACRDALIGVRFVDGTGAVVRNGGRVMKNVTGYDLVKLMAGSRGTLGVLTEVSFKVQAIPEAEATLLAEGLAPEAALAAMRAALNSPFEVSGAAHLEAAAAGGASRSLIRIEGMAGSVAYRLDRLREIVGPWAAVEGEASAALWRGVRDVAPFAGRPGAVWRLALRPTSALGPVAALQAAGLDHAAIWDWAGGRLWLCVTGASDGGAAVIRAGLDGHATLIRPEPGMAAVPVFPPEPAPVAGLTRALRARFDPRGILNPGLMG
ncbi:MAG: FAD-binding protein [Rhodobacterales bacterium]|nr:FAD-binding protein [Rhodobacterales bacterium]